MTFYQNIFILSAVQPFRNFLTSFNLHRRPDSAHCRPSIPLSDSIMNISTKASILSYSAKAIGSAIVQTS